MSHETIVSILLGTVYVLCGIMTTIIVWRKNNEK